nr:MAG TPA: RNA polymerase sigma factor [Caudoviricetes sp.]
MFINYRLADGSTILVEVTEETAAFILENDREMANADRKERYHCPYHIEAMQYEGDSLAYYKTLEDIAIREEEKQHINDTLSFLTDAQLRRLTMKADGMALREIAKAKGTSVNAVRESLEAAKRKFKKHF